MISGIRFLFNLQLPFIRVHFHKTLYLFVLFKVVGNAAPAVVGTLSAGPDGLPLRDAFLGVVGGSYVLSSALFAAVAASLEATDTET